MEDARLVAALEEGPPVVAMRIHGHENNNDDDDDDLPVAVALGRQRHRDARARNREGHDLRRIMMMRGGPAAWRGGGGRLEGNANVEGNADNNVLWSLLQEGVHCSAHDLATAQGSCARVVERCLHHPADIHFLCQATGRTPLHEAALRCHCIHVLQALRQEDTQVFVLDRRGNTPLHLLLQGMATRQLQDSRLLALVEELLRGSPSSLAATANLDGYNALHLTCLGPEAMVPPSIVTRILRANPACASRPSRQGEFPLHLHCQRRKAASVQVAQMLLQAHPPALRVLDGSHGWTPLHYACAKLNTPLITLLLEADSGAVWQRSTQAGETPLHVLCRQKPHTEEHVRALRALLHVAPELAAQRDARPSHSVTPLHSLLQSVTIPSEAIQAVVEVAPAAVRVADSEGLLPLHVACHVGVDTDAVVALLQVDPQTAHAQTRKLDTPLSLACSTNRSLGTVRLLLEVSPESARVANDYGYCPLHCLVRTYQPSRAMALALLKTAPDILQAATNGGETPIHLLSNNGSASSSIFHDMSKALRKVDVTPVGSGGGSNIRSGDTPSLPPVVKTKIGNTPLHYACFRSAGREQIEALVMHHPEWLPIQNSGGFTPLQILCKSGRVDAELITLFARLGGPSIFSMVDSTGNTPLHSAVRVETDVAALQALIRACPKALQMRTIYEDTPLHLACLRQVSAAVVHEVATASCEGLEVSLANCDQLISPIFLRNSAGQTPISIAMEDNQKAFSQTARRCTVEVGLAATQRRAFDVLAILAKMLHYGPATMDEMEGQNLVLACVSLHRKNVRLDPTFIRRAILASPEQVAECDEEGNYPLHYEAGVPIEKMSLLDGPTNGCCGGACAKRSGVLHLLWEIYPAAAKHRNSSGYFPLSLMIQNGRPWDRTFSQILRWHPQAFHWLDGVTPKVVPHILARVYRDCGKETVLSLLRTRPDMIVVEEDIRANSQTTEPRNEEETMDSDSSHAAGPRINIAADPVAGEAAGLRSEENLNPGTSQVTDSGVSLNATRELSISGVRAHRSNRRCLRGWCGLL